MRHLLLSRLLLRSSSPSHHHLLRPLSSSSPLPASDSDLRKYAGYALLVLGCGAATYYSFPLPPDALHKKAVPFKYAPLPEDLHTVSNWSATHEVHTRVLLQPDCVPALQGALATAHKERRKLRPLGSGLSPNGLALSRAGMVNLALMDKVLDVDVKKKTVTVQAGIRVAELVDALREHGLTLQNFASIREQQVGGIIQPLPTDKEEGYASMVTFFHPELKPRLSSHQASAALARHIAVRWEAGEEAVASSRC